MIYDFRTCCEDTSRSWNAADPMAHIEYGPTPAALEFQKVMEATINNWKCKNNLLPVHIFMDLGWDVDLETPQLIYFVSYERFDGKSLYII